MTMTPGVLTNTATARPSADENHGRMGRETRRIRWCLAHQQRPNTGCFHTLRARGCARPVNAGAAQVVSVGALPPLRCAWPVNAGAAQDQASCCCVLPSCARPVNAGAAQDETHPPSAGRGLCPNSPLLRHATYTS